MVGLGFGNQDMSDNWQTLGSDRTLPCILRSLQHSASKTLTAISFIGFIQSLLQRATLKMFSHAVFWQIKKGKIPESLLLPRVAIKYNIILMMHLI